MAEMRIGCSGWSYSSWVGPFYPKGAPQTSWLQHYAKAFDYVEVDSTFYSIPSPFRVKKWFQATPDNFRFTAKLPKFITHDKAFYNVDRELELFYSAMAPLKEKLLCLLIQLPPSITFGGGFTALRNFLRMANPRYRYAVEVRHRSWFDDEFYSFLRKENVALVWNQLDAIQAPPVVTTDFVYIRFIGDRSIQEHEFGRIQKDRIHEMEFWADELENLPSSVKIGVVAANNHYAGFGPGTASTFRAMIGLPEAKVGSAQTSLADFGVG